MGLYKPAMGEPGPDEFPCISDEILSDIVGGLFDFFGSIVS